MTLMLLIQIICISILVFLSVYYLLLLLMMKRAVRKTNIPLPRNWQIIIIGNMIFMTASILFILLSPSLF